MRTLATRSASRSARSSRSHMSCQMVYVPWVLLGAAKVGVAAGEAARAVVLRLLDEPTDQDIALFDEFGRRCGLDIYLQRGGPGTVRALDPESARPLAYTLSDFDVTLRFVSTGNLASGKWVNIKLSNTITTADKS